jgi:two-component system response regulator AtoC
LVSFSEKYILIVDDDKNMCRSLSAVFKKKGFGVYSVFSNTKAKTIIKEKKIDIILADLKLPDGTGIELYRYLKQEGVNMPVIIITGNASVTSAIEAMKTGVYDYITKPFNIDEMLLVIHRALEKTELEKENIYLHRELSSQYAFKHVVGKNSRMIEIYETVKKIANSDVTALLRGESGTGKELIAKAIHYNGNRKKRRFVPVACGAIPETLLESELFGYEKGAFTGALSAKPGLFEIAAGGTIFFDEIGDLSPAVQMKLLRVIQEKEFQRLGGTKIIKADVRLVSATNKNLEDKVKQGSFRDDLYYRINVVAIFLPPLRERKEDIPLLVKHFIRKYTGGRDKKLPPFKGVSKKVMDIFMGYGWPGNVRELENVVERSVALEENDLITVKSLPPDFGEIERRDQSCGEDFKTVREQFEKDFINKALIRSKGNVVAAARQINLSRRQLYEKIKRYDIVVRKQKIEDGSQKPEARSQNEKS